MQTSAEQLLEIDRLATFLAEKRIPTGVWTPEVIDGAKKYYFDLLIEFHTKPESAKLAFRSFRGEMMWGFICPEGFAPFGPTLTDKEQATDGVGRYNTGEGDWAFAKPEDLV